MVVLVSRLKSRQKVEESSKSPKKPQRPEKLQRSSIWRNVYRNTNPPSNNSSFCYNSDSFLGSFCWIQELSKYHFRFDYCQDKAGCHIVFIQGTSFIQVPLHRVFVCKTRIFPPPNSGNVLRKKTYQPLIKAEMFDGREVVEEVVYLQGIIMRVLRY